MWTRIYASVFVLYPRRLKAVNFDNSHNSFLWPEYFIEIFWKPPWIHRFYWSRRGGGRNPITPLSRYDSVSKLLPNDITKVIMLGKLITVAAYILKRSSLVSEEVKSIKFWFPMTRIFHGYIDSEITFLAL